MVLRAASREKNLKKNQRYVFLENMSIKKDSDLQLPSKKSSSHFIEILHAKGHFDYLNEGYRLYNNFLHAAELFI